MSRARLYRQKPLRTPRQRPVLRSLEHRRVLLERKDCHRSATMREGTKQFRSIRAGFTGLSLARIESICQRDWAPFVTDTDYVINHKGPIHVTP
jgi:hypothetical protein